MKPRFVAGNRIELLETGAEYFPALIAAIDAAATEVHLQTYIFANDATGRAVSAADLPAPPAAWVETWTGDRLPGQVLLYQEEQRLAGTSEPAHLLVRSVTSTFPPREQTTAEVRLRAACVRRIVWQRSSINPKRLSSGESRLIAGGKLHAIIAWPISAQPLGRIGARLRVDGR